MDPRALPADAWIHVPTLLVVSVAVMFSIAIVMALFGATHRVYRGYWAWTFAMAVAPLGTVFMSLRPQWPLAAVPGGLLLMSWPMLVLLGVRRFHVRDAQLGTRTTDALVFTACFGVWLALWANHVPDSIRLIAFVLGMLVLHLHACVVMAWLVRARSGTALRMMIGVLLLAGSVPALRLVWVMFFAQPGSVVGHPLLSVGVVLPQIVGMLCAAYLCLVLTHERTVEDLHETQRQLRELADIDMLTQVPNRRRVEELAQRIVGHAAAVPTVLMLFDIDHFKLINDTHGHAAGDEALRVVARCARETLRTRDVLGRIGGDEFMLLLPGATVDHALQIADRITRRLDAQHGAGALSLSLSFGVVQLEPGEPMDAAQRRADAALYEAKRQGRRRAVPAGMHGRHTVFGESKALGLDPLAPV
ncbi:MAG TPA: GGDEF domain-containing protein [Methylibium sp.]|uniref:GGDEF domain-containing protein n=1 Tax=Methylibium sp. TaxID=2067992 RepID=UPI002DB96951|nr:GGDEF domain-containing protein [Methylibium sp.]HEU4457724.1 GGDEF domain-containing protein [Methylibium sp.]